MRYFPNISRRRLFEHGDVMRAAKEMVAKVELLKFSLQVKSYRSNHREVPITQASLLSALIRFKYVLSSSFS